jgi:hypothetical protein
VRRGRQDRPVAAARDRTVDPARRQQVLQRIVKQIAPGSIEILKREKVPRSAYKNSDGDPQKQNQTSTLPSGPELAALRNGLERRRTRES